MTKNCTKNHPQSQFLSRHFFVPKSVPIEKLFCPKANSYRDTFSPKPIPIETLFCPKASSYRDTFSPKPVQIETLSSPKPVPIETLFCPKASSYRNTFFTHKWKIEMGTKFLKMPSCTPVLGEPVAHQASRGHAAGWPWDGFESKILEKRPLWGRGAGLSWPTNALYERPPVKQ